MTEIDGRYTRTGGSNNPIRGASAESPWPIDESLGSYCEGDG